MKLTLFLFTFFVFCWASAAGPRPLLPKPYVVTPLIFDGQNVSDVWVFPRENPQEFAIEAAPVLDLLSRQMKPEYLTNVKALVLPNGTLSLQSLNAAGVKTFFHEADLELQMTVPLKYRLSQDLRISSADPGAFGLLRPTTHSGYMNFYLSQPYRDTRESLSGHLDLVENLNGLVFESGVNYDEKDSYIWKRQDTRLRFDDEDSRIRYTLGDLNLRAQGFQVSPALGGFSLVREFGIQPYRTLRPLSRTEILIRRNSLVEIWVNGFLYSQLRLAPGIFNIRDFPLSVGQNNVRVKVKDDLGQEETFDFTALFENSLLSESEHEFSYAAGTPWRVSGSDRAYNEDPFVSFYHRLGLTDTYTTGVNFQNYANQALVGLENSVITGYGFLSLDLAHSSHEVHLKGFAERFRYRSLEQMGGYDLPVTGVIELENRDEDFRQILSAAPSAEQFLRRYDLQLNFRPASYWTLSLGGTRLENLAASWNLYRAQAVIPLKYNTRLEVSYNKEALTQQSQPTTQDRYFLSFTWYEPQGRLSASSYYDSRNDSIAAQLSRNNVSKYDDYRLSTSLQKNQQGHNEYVVGEYYTQPALLRAEYYNSYDKATSSNSDTTTLGLNTGFAWVGSHGAWTQPISDSFALVTLPDLPKKAELKINPNGEFSEAQLGPRTSVVLKDYASYYKYHVNLDSTTLPAGYLLEKEYFEVQPTYRSGLLLAPKLQRRVLVRGRLISAGLPVSLVAGDIYNSKGELVDNTFFTNRQGQFLIEGLEAGTYRLVTDQRSLTEVSFVVSETSEAQLNLGDLAIPKGDVQ